MTSFGGVAADDLLLFAAARRVQETGNLKTRFTRRIRAAAAAMAAEDAPTTESLLMMSGHVDNHQVRWFGRVQLSMRSNAFAVILLPP